MARLDVEGAAFADDCRRVAHQRRDARAVERRRHRDETQILAQPRLCVERERESQIGVERTLVIFVEERRRDALERGIVQDHAREDAFGDHLDPRARAHARFEPHAQADGFADLLAEH